jgi:hypothetical protein
LLLPKTLLEAQQHFFTQSRSIRWATVLLGAFAPSMIGKWLEMLNQVAPGITRAAVIFNPKTAPSGGSFFLEPFEQLAPSFAIAPIAARVENADEIARTIAKLAQEPGGGLVIMPDAFLASARNSGGNSVGSLYSSLRPWPIRAMTNHQVSSKCLS